MVEQLIIKRETGEALVGGRPLRLSRTELATLVVLAQAAGQVLTRREVLDRLHPGNYSATDRAVDVQISGLRKKLRPGNRFIETIRGVGFRWIAESPRFTD